MKNINYLPLIPKLKRLYASMSSAPYIRYKNRWELGVLCHPSNGEVRKHFDQTYPDFATEPQNIRLDLYADGFTPYSQLATPYSCWLVIITLYNLSPKLYMTTLYIFLTLIILNLHNLKSRIDIYFQSC